MAYLDFEGRKLWFDSWKLAFRRPYDTERRTWGPGDVGTLDLQVVHEPEGAAFVDVDCRRVLVKYLSGMASRAGLRISNLGVHHAQGWGRRNRGRLSLSEVDLISFEEEIEHHHGPRARLRWSLPPWCKIQIDSEGERFDRSRHEGMEVLRWGDLELPLDRTRLRVCEGSAGGQQFTDVKVLVETSHPLDLETLGRVVEAVRAPNGSTTTHSMMLRGPQELSAESVAVVAVEAGIAYAQQGAQPKFEIEWQVVTPNQRWNALR